MGSSPGTSAFLISVSKLFSTSLIATIERMRGGGKRLRPYVIRHIDSGRGMARKQGGARF